MSVEDYEIGWRLCKKVFAKMYDLVIRKGEYDREKLRLFGEQELEKVCTETIKKCFPVCISINNCVGFYVKEKAQEVNLKSRDIVKIEYGLVVNEKRVHFGESFQIEGGKGDGIQEDYSLVLKELKKVPRRLCKKVVAELDEVTGTKRIINDDIANFIAGECTKFDCYPAENVMSYKLNVGMGEYEMDMNRVILGFRKKLDESGDWILLDNPCCDIEEGDVYSLDITIIPEREDLYTYNSKTYKQNEHIYLSPHASHVYRWNGTSGTLKLRSVRDFFNKIKKNHQEYAFDYTQYQEDVKSRLGLRELLKGEIVTEYKIRYLKESTRPVFFFKCLIYRKEDKLHLIE